MKEYRPRDFEPKWQKFWHEQKTFRVDLKSQSKKFYIFGMFNYPSGAGIHVGHVRNFVIPDVLARFQRQQGYEVYQPVGFDSFGLPAENYALKTGTPPRQTTDAAIETYRQQYKALGFSFDWSRQIDTSQPDYYRWTQWCFLQLFKAGLAYQKESLQWWCGQCQTVLADEQVTAGRCWRHDSPDDPLIGRKSLRQWFFKITDYAQDLVKATPDLNWTEWVKTAQINYIGRSEGLEIDFELDGLGLSQKLKIFTTAPETIYGATFMVLAPEHPLVGQILPSVKNSSQIKDYIKASQQKSELERKQAKTKQGVLVKDLVAIHPISSQPLPIWIADYVLSDYGTGAIMAVPGADQRDRDFARAHNLKIVYPTKMQEFVDWPQMKQDLANYSLASNDDLDGLDLVAARPGILRKLGPAASSKVDYRLRDWLISRQRYWGAPIPVIHCQACGALPVPEKDLPVKLPQISDYRPAGDGRSPLAKAQEWLEVICPECGGQATRETDTMDGYVCSSWYQLRYLDPHNDQAAWSPEITNHWLPVDFYSGADHATAHLIYARFFTRFFADQGLLADPEPFARFQMHAKVLASDGQNFSKSKGNGIDPLEIIEQGYGADALRVYICMAAPPDTEIIWDDHGVPGAYRFLKRCYQLVQGYLEAKKEGGDLDQPLNQATHRCIFKVSQDIGRLKYNTALAAQMELVNQLYKLGEKDNFGSAPWPDTLKTLAGLLAPFAPHLAQEIWADLGQKGTVCRFWPQVQETWLATEKVTVAVTVNGKRRAEVEVLAQATKDEVLALAQKAVKRYLTTTPKKQIYVEGKIVNFVL